MGKENTDDFVLVRRNQDTEITENDAVSISITETPIVRISDKIKVKFTLTQLMCLTNLTRGLLVKTQSELYDFRGDLLVQMHLLNLTSLLEKLRGRLTRGKEGTFSIPKTWCISFFIQSNHVTIPQGQTANVAEGFRALIHKACSL